MTALAPRDGAMRAQVDEGVWAAIVPEPFAATPLAALPVDRAPRPEDVELVATGELAAHGRAALTVTTVSGTTGLYASIGTDGATVGQVVRALHVTDDETTLIPGVEVSLYTAERIVDEVMRLVPPVAEVAVDSDEEFLLPLEEAKLLAVARRAGDARVVAEIVRKAGWAELPPPLRLVDHTSGSIQVTLRAEDRPPRVLQWLHGEFGWVRIGLRGDRLTHRLVTREQIRDDVTYRVTGIYDVFAGVGSRG